MTRIICLRTGTAIALKLRREGTRNRWDEAAERILGQWKAYLEGQANQGKLEQLSLQLQKDGFDLLCIPKTGQRIILEMSDAILQQLQQKGLSAHITWNRWEA